MICKCWGCLQLHSAENFWVPIETDALHCVHTPSLSLQLGLKATVGRHLASVLCDIHGIVFPFMGFDGLAVQGLVLLM